MREGAITLSFCGWLTDPYTLLVLRGELGNVGES